MAVVIGSRPAPNGARILNWKVGKLNGCRNRLTSSTKWCQNFGYSGHASVREAVMHASVRDFQKGWIFESANRSPRTLPVRHYGYAMERLVRGLSVAPSDFVAFANPCKPLQILGNPC